jgi:hypothetical protein
MPRSSHPTALLFVDPTASLPNLPAQIAPKAELLALDADQDGVEQITMALSRRTGLQRLHIVSSCRAGSLQLGKTQLTLFNLDRYGWELQQWGESLAAEAEIVFHEGAGLDADDLSSQVSGQFSSMFLNRLHLLTGAKIRQIEAQIRPQQSVGF